MLKHLVSSAALKTFVLFFFQSCPAMRLPSLQGHLTFMLMMMNLLLTFMEGETGRKEQAFGEIIYLPGCMQYVAQQYAISKMGIGLVLREGASTECVTSI